MRSEIDQRGWVSLWAKTERGGERWHPLVLHLLDVSASADAILAREPESTRVRMSRILGMDWEAARRLLLLLISCHDLGKACPGFQCKWKDLTGLAPVNPDTGINHAFVSQVVLHDLLVEKGWPPDLSELVSDAVGCHHGERAKPHVLDQLSGNRRALGNNDYGEIRRGLFNAMVDTIVPGTPPAKATLDGPDFMLLSGLTSFADWIGSNEEWFPYGTPENCDDLAGWFDRRRNAADKALDAIGWSPRVPLVQTLRSFEELFHKSPRPLQQAVSEAVANIEEPSILLVEAPMGEGKTEAAFLAHLELQRRLGHRGLYVALPTRATGNAMFTRTLAFLRSLGIERPLDLQLLHGAASLNDAFQAIHPKGICDEQKGGDIRAGEWFTHKKRALLSEYGVGTADQAIVPILPVRHNFVRLWGLANRVVVFDEVHAYDAYTGMLLLHLFRWLLALGSSVILLSATLPPSIRRKLGEVVNAELPPKEPEYPRLSTFRPGLVQQVHFPADAARRQLVRLQGIGSELPNLLSTLQEQMVSGGMGLALVNTVHRAQELYRLFPEGKPVEREGKRIGKRLADGTEVFLFHARYPADWRQTRENHAIEQFGEDERREGRKILIATQVAEQSLDLDFDLIVTDLAPIDLILQRAGRLWRHQRGTRPVPEPVLLVSGLVGDEPPSFGKPLWWGAVYREDVLLRTWILLRRKQDLNLPEEIDDLVQAVYEEHIEVPEILRERMEKALAVEEGETSAFRVQANQAIIGLPDDASWNDPGRFVLYDEDEPGMHRTLMAHTRLGDESLIAVPFSPTDDFRPEVIPDVHQGKQLFMRAMSLSRKGVVHRLRGKGVPEGWRSSPLLRNCYPVILDQEGRWTEDATVRLDDDLGLVYEPKEGE